MASVLRSVHAQCGRKPHIGKVFAVRGTGSAAVFFTVVNRMHGDTPVAGLIIASPGASGHVEAALVSNDAQRFGSTVNPMLKTLFGVWHPGSRPRSAHSDRPSEASARADVPKMEKVTASDGSASVSLPKDWKMNP